MENSDNEWKIPIINVKFRYWMENSDNEFKEPLKKR